MKKKYYDKKYFQKRDHLDLHIAQTLEIFMHTHHLKKTLDVGCGTGRLTKFLNEHGFDATGCDKEEQALRIARKINKKSKIKKATADRLPFKNQTFDLVTSLSVIEHLTKKEANTFILETKRVLKKDGFIFIITPNFTSPMRYIKGKNWFGYSDPTHIQFFTPKTLSKLLQNHGFQHIQLRFKTAKNVDFDWNLPKSTRSFPMPFKNFLNYLLIESPLATCRDSFWIAAQK